MLAVKEIHTSLNSRTKQIQNRIVYEDFKEYNNDRLQRLWKYAQLSGLKEFSL